MSTIFVNIALSLDGFRAPEGMTMENWDRPDYKNWGAKWGALMAWALDQQYLRARLGLGPGGETGPVNDLVRHTFERTGAHIMGKRMFNGVIDEVEIFNRALSPAEVQAVYNAGSAGKCKAKMINPNPNNPTN